MDLEPLPTELEPLPENGESAPSPAQRPPTAARHVVALGAIARPVTPVVSEKFTQAEPTTTTSESEPTPVASSAAQSPPPRFTISVSKSPGSVSANLARASVAGSNSPSLGGTADTPLSSASVDVPARLRAGNVPAYTPAALAAGIEGNVPLEIVIGETGLVTSARGLEHVGYGLDEAARQSVLGYRFTPAMRKNRPVPVRMRWLMRFQLR
jgi:protein TonB